MKTKKLNTNSPIDITENNFKGIKNMDSLLEEILTQTRHLANADAGSIYIPVSEHGIESLQIKCGQNDTTAKRLAPGKKQPYVYFTFPINQDSICGYVASEGAKLNIPDVYNISPEKPYKFDTTSDLLTQYKTTSMLTYPLKSQEGKILAVVQLINAKDKDENVIPFSEETDIYVSHFIASEVLPILQSFVQKSDNIARFSQIKQKLSEIQDKDILLEQLLTVTRNLVNADAGSIYEIKNIDGKDRLQIIHGQNDTRSKLLKPGEKLPYTSFDFPVDEKSICGYVAKNRKTLNIPNVRNIASSTPFKFNEFSDMITNYRTVSMCTVPLKGVSGKLLGVIQLINARNEDYENYDVHDDNRYIPFSSDSQQLIEYLAQDVAQILTNIYIIESKNRQILLSAEYRDPKESYPHTQRVSAFAVEIFDRYAFNKDFPLEQREKFRQSLKSAAQFHDMGKVGISDLILKKPGSFTDEERMIINAHTLMGAKYFEEQDGSDIDKMALEINLHHHERWDGGPTGYPGKVQVSDLYYEDNCWKFTKGEPMKGEEIPLSARIVSVADVFDALSHQRCYKKAWSIEDSFNEIERCSGTQFDPDVVQAFLEIKERIIKINESISN